MKEAASGISRDVWLAALREIDQEVVADDDQNAITSVEFAAMTGLGRATALKRLNALVAAGKAEVVRKRVSRGGGGGLYPAPAYRLK